MKRNAMRAPRMLVDLGEEQGLLVPARRSASVSSAGPAAKQGDIGKGLALLSEGVATLHALGRGIRPAVGKYLLSDVLALSGRRAEALACAGRGTGILAWHRSLLAGRRVASKEGRASSCSTPMTTPTGRNRRSARPSTLRASNRRRLFELRAGDRLARLWSARGRRAAARNCCGHCSPGSARPSRCSGCARCPCVARGLDVGLLRA